MPTPHADGLPVEIVDTADAVTAMLAQLSAADLVAADMEFSNDTTRVLLMQFATDDRIFLFDPLAVRDISPVLSWLADPDHRKIFHSGHDDTRLVSRQFQVETRGVLDTQIFAAFGGHRYPVGLATLLDAMVGVNLSKGQQRSNWGSRPLSSGQVRYAALDVRYLREILDRMIETLAGTGKEDWAREESRRVVEERAGLSTPAAADWRFVDDWRGSPEETLVAWRLLDWSRGLRLPRVQGKKRKVRPRDLERLMRRIASGATIAPGGRDVPDWLTEEHVREIEAMRSDPPTAAEVARRAQLPPPGPPTGERGNRVAAVMAHIETRCDEENIATSLVTSKTAVEDLVRFGAAAESALTTGWRAELLGPLPG